MSEDLHGRVEVDEGVEAVAGRVLAAELPVDAPSEPCVGADLVTRPQQCLVKLGTEPTKLVVGAWRSGIDDAPISQNDDQRVEGSVAILHHAAAHARGVVRENAADHCGIDRRGVGADAPQHRGEYAVEVPPHDRRLRPHPLAAVEDAPRLPVGSELDEQVVRHRLPGQRRPRGSQGEPTPRPPRVGQKPPHLIHVAGTDDGLGHEAVDRGVGRPTETVDRAREHALGREQGLEVPNQTGVDRAQPGPLSQSYSVAAGMTGTVKR